MGGARARPPDPLGRRRLEVAPSYACNLRCLGCRACRDTGESLPSERIAQLLREAHSSGVRGAWFGGGEPTLRRDLLALVRHARSLGYDEVCVQTNGLRLAYEEYARALVDAGVTEVRLNAKSHLAEVHDRLSGLPGAHGLLLRALDNLVAVGPDVHVVADVLATRSTVAELSRTIAFFGDRGVRAFAVWLLSSADEGEQDEVSLEVPRMTDLVSALEQGVRIARERGCELVSFHTPPCTLPASLRSVWRPARDLGMTVVDAGGHAFALESSPFEGGAFVEACTSCAARRRCAGPRADYLRIHGASEFRALAPTDL